MAENKTQPTDASVAAYIDAAGDEARRQDLTRLVAMMSEITGQPAVMWGSTMVGFGSYHYRYESGREGDALKVGFSSRGRKIALYGVLLYEQQSSNEALLEDLGPHERGKSCLYIKSLAAIDDSVLQKMIKNGYSAELS